GWLGQIAWKIQQGRGEKNDSVVIGKARVEEIFRQGILDTGLNEEEAEQETTFIMDYIAERSGLFIPRGESKSGETLYAFTHLSFMEYFAAAHLRSEVEFWEKDGAEWQDLREKMQEPVWKEVFILFFELMKNARQTEQYLTRLVGDRPDIVVASDNVMPVLKKPYRGINVWPGFYAWAVLAGIIMDTAVKMPLRFRQEYIRLLWRFVLSFNVRESGVFIDGGVGSVVEHLWTEKADSLVELQRQAADMEALQLTGHAINDPTPLRRLIKLKELHLNNTEVNELAPLSKLVNLKELGLGGTEVDDLAPLTRLVKLEELYLHNTKVNNLNPLSELVNLEVLYLRNSKVSDLNPLCKLVNLEKLSLHNTKVYDLTPLSGLVNLKELDLQDTKVRESDVGALRKKLPHTKIIFDED
ncbi:MAG: leucine-rich repeat domain-containing protein, partial [Candidatus Electrothrix sp. ATG2]|nr:leucine-rich repeat domain-containing protein [Candidatus Electrothrix sp. ATG2]